MAKKLTSEKAKEILRDKSVHGKPLTEKQRKFFGAIAGGAKPYKAEDGGWLDRYEEGGVLKQKTTDNYGTKPNANNSDVSLPPGFKGWAYNTKGRNYSPAWGGQFQDGGNLIPAMAGANQTIPMYQMGGSLPGAVGFMYARTINPAPSNGPYAKKTKASAQNGQEMKFYQAGLDFTPKTISQDGKKIKMIPRATGDLRGPKIDPRMSSNIAAAQQRDKQSKEDAAYETLRRNPALKLYSDDEIVRLAKNPSKWPKHVSNAYNYEEATKNLIESHPDYNPEISLEEQRGLANDNSLRTRIVRGKNLVQNTDLGSFPLNLAKGIMYAPGTVATNLALDPYNRYVKPGVAEGLTNVLSDAMDAIDLGAPSVLAKGIGAGLAGAMKLSTVMPFYRMATQNIDPQSVRAFEDAVDRARDVVSTPEARQAFRNVGDRIASTRGLAAADPSYATAVTNPNLPMQTIDEMARVLTETDAANVALTKPQRNYLKGLGDISTDISRIQDFTSEQGAGDWLLENTQNLSPRDIVPFMYPLRIPDNEKRDLIKRLYTSRASSVVANPLADYTAARDLFSLAENYSNLSTILTNRSLTATPFISGSSLLGNQLRQAVTKMVETAPGVRKNFEIDPRYFEPQGDYYNTQEIFHALFRDPYSGLPSSAERAANVDFVKRRIDERRREVFENPSNIGRTFVGSSSMSADSYDLAMRGIPIGIRAGARPVPIYHGQSNVFPSGANDFAGIVRANEARENYLENVRKAIAKSSTPTLDVNQLSQISNVRSSVKPTLIKNIMLESKMANSVINDVNRAIGSNIPASRISNIGRLDRPLIGLIPQGGPATQFQDGGNVDSMGYWNPDNWGKPVTIPSTDITMQGVYEPLIGISDTGDVQYMEPGEDYQFDGEYVTEYPVAKKGISVNEADAQPIKKLDQLLNFTNYNKPTKGGWLNKYR